MCGPWEWALGTRTIAGFYGGEDGVAGHRVVVVVGGMGKRVFGIWQSHCKAGP